MVVAYALVQCTALVYQQVTNTLCLNAGMKQSKLSILC